MKKFLAACCLALGVGISASAEEAPAAKDWFPILAWGQTFSYNPGREKIQEDFDLMKECGFTIAGFSREDQLDMIAKAGLKAYYWDDALDRIDFSDPDNPELPKIVANAIEKIRDRDEVIGIYLRDEPSSALFPTLGVLSREIRKQAPELIPYINLLPNYATTAQLGCPSYDEYLKRYTEICSMPYLSYDFYSLPENREDPISDLYWLNLDQARNASKDAGIDFHYCTLGVTLFDWRQPTLEDLYFEVYSALLYGAKGLSIFTYFTPTIGNFRNAAINEFGDRTQVWYDLKQVLRSVQNRAELLNQLDSVAVYHIPLVEREKGTRGFDENSLLKGISPDPRAHFAVGEFVHRETGETYIMILNKDFVHSYPIRLEWQGKQPVRVEINPASQKGQWSLYEGEQRWIAPGHVHLLRVTFE